MDGNVLGSANAVKWGLSWAGHLARQNRGVHA